MKCIVGFNITTFRVSKTWWHLYFLSKYNLLKFSNKNKFKAQLNTFFGRKQAQERNTTPTTPAAAPIKFQEWWKEMAPLWWKRKQNVLQGISKWKKTCIFPRGLNLINLFVIVLIMLVYYVIYCVRQINKIKKLKKKRIQTNNFQTRDQWGTRYELSS